MGEGESGGKGAGIKKHKRSERNRHREVKNSIGNGKAKLICMTHGHELRGDCWREEGYWVEGAKGENWDNCNSKNNKIYLKNTS